MFTIARNTIGKKFNGYIVVMNVRKKFSSAKNSSLQYIAVPDDHNIEGKELVRVDNYQPLWEKLEKHGR